MMAARRKCSTGKPPEEKKASNQSVTESEEQENQKADEVKETQGSRDRKSEKTMKSVPEFPFMEKEIPDLVKDQKGTSGFQNRAPLQADERARDLLRSTLQHPISLTAEDLLNVSEPMRNELKKLLTKRRVERKSVTFVEEANKTDGPWRDLSVRKVVSELPEATCEILEEDWEGMHKGSIVIGDPVSQFLATLKPSQNSFSSKRVARITSDLSLN